MIKLFVSDIDSTLYDHRTGIPNANIEALKRLQNQGVIVVLASGRMAQAMYHSAQMIGLDQYGGYVIASNGAWVEHITSGQVIRESTFEPSEIQRFALSAVFLGAHFTVDQGKELYYTHHDRSYHWMKKVGHVEVQRIVDVQKQLLRKATRCSVSVDDGAHVLPLDAFIRAHQHEASIERLQARYLDMMPLGNSKWVGIEALMSHLNIQTHEVAVIGDGENDRSMMSHAGLSACVLNADKSIQALCDVVVNSVTEAGVAEFAELVMRRNGYEG
jgi:Cof subfamily protein (haloacid dehalogenase superfamily)